MTRVTLLAMTLAFSGAVAGNQFAHAQVSSAAPQDAHQMTGHGMGMPMPEDQMMAMHHKMMTDMSAMDARLDALVLKMSKAKGASKADAMAEALTALVQAHKAMHDGMMQTMTAMHGPMAMPMAGAR